MTGFDVAVVAIAGVLTLLGLLKGMVRVLIGLGALILAFMVASRFHRPLGDWFAGIPDWPEGPMQLLAYLAILFPGSTPAKFKYRPGWLWNRKKGARP